MDDPPERQSGRGSIWIGAEYIEQLPTPSPTPSPVSRSATLENEIFSQASSRVKSMLSSQKNAAVLSIDPMSDSTILPRNETAVDGDDKNSHNIRKPISPVGNYLERDRVLKLSPAKIHELTSSPTSLPLRTTTQPLDEAITELSPIIESTQKHESTQRTDPRDRESTAELRERSFANGSAERRDGNRRNLDTRDMQNVGFISGEGSSLLSKSFRPDLPVRATSTPVMRRKQSSANRSRAPLQEHNEKLGKVVSTPIGSKDNTKADPALSSAAKPSPLPESLSSPASALPLPPLSIPTYLQLELSTERPSPLYIHRSSTTESLYESSTIKLERLRDFLSLCFFFEPFVGFGFFVCLDAWLYFFTILPLRFINATWILCKWWAYCAAKEAKDIASFVYLGVGRVWRRRSKKDHRLSLVSTSVASGGSKAKRGSNSINSSGASRDNCVNQMSNEDQSRKYRSRVFKHRSSKSTPSALKPSHKADLLRGLLVITSCSVLMRYDASRMYHSIRGQAAIKLYVIYNALEVGDRLLSALGQDVLECLFCDENLERDTNGRSKIIRPFWMFILALFYTTLHATALFYQVITLNVAVNSYSNALLTLLMSNQFVEVKSTVFKKIEKENLFQLACADIVERFQLWLMLLIIAMRNVVEVGGLSISLSNAMGPVTNDTPSQNSSSSFFGSVTPAAFTILPDWVGQVLTPFLIVLCSEMVVDWIKHAYTCKFNNVKSNIYGRFLDVIAKDYYSHAFTEHNLTKRFGLPVIPLACLFIRALVQTYHMFLATHMPLPIPSPTTSLSVDNPGTSAPATTAAIAQIDRIFRRALGRSSFGAASEAPESGFSWWSFDDLVAFATMTVVFLIFYLLVLAFKLVLGMCLLGYSRRRYTGMKDRERQMVDTHGRRLGLWGMTELGDERRQWIYADDPDGLQSMKERERKGKEKTEKGRMDLESVQRYAMVAKRIW